jgi:ERCC4-type nuclease
MRPSVPITADSFERRSEIPRFLEELGASVCIERLRVGDYDVGGNTLVERKSVLDLHSCLVSRRLWVQLGGLRKEARYPFLLVEGADIDDGPLSPASLRGACLSAMRLGIRLIRTTDPQDSALWMYRLAILCQRRPGPRTS